MKLFIYIAYSFLCIAFFLSLIVYKQLEREFKLVAWFLFLSTVIQVLSLFMFSLSLNNLFLLHFYVPLGFIFISSFYKIIHEVSFSSNFFLLLILAFTGFCLFDSMFIEPVNSFNSLALSIESILVMIFSIFTYVASLNIQFRNANENVMESLNWINSGFFLYFSGNLIFYFIGDVVMNKSFPLDLSWLSWLPHAVLSTILYICLTVGIWKNSRL